MVFNLTGGFLGMVRPPYWAVYFQGFWGVHWGMGGTCMTPTFFCLSPPSNVKSTTVEGLAGVGLCTPNFPPRYKTPFASAPQFRCWDAQELSPSQFNLACVWVLLMKWLHPSLGSTKQTNSQRPNTKASTSNGLKSTSTISRSMDNLQPQVHSSRNHWKQSPVLLLLCDVIHSSKW